MKIAVLHGVNLNMFGKRDPVQYGTITLDEINDMLLDLALKLGITLDIYQTNDECKMVEKIHSCHSDGTCGIVINAGAWSHYSYAIADALAILKVPVVEAHMSNIYAREEFRAKSVISSIAKGCICGFGVQSYLLALKAAEYLAKQK